MRYGAVITKYGKQVLATFPGCDGLVTAGSPEEIEHLAKDALVGWLKAHLDLGAERVAGKRLVPQSGLFVTQVKQDDRVAGGFIVLVHPARPSSAL